jgi:hypothetical protein
MYEIEQNDIYRGTAEDLQSFRRVAALPDDLKTGLCSQQAGHAGTQQSLIVQ